MLPARLYALPLKSVDQPRRAVSPWVASSILFPPFLQIAVDGRIGRAAFVEQLLQSYYCRLARIEGYGGEVGHLVAEDEGIVRHLDEKLSPAFRALQRLDHIGLFVRDGKHGFHFRQALELILSQNIIKLQTTDNQV